ncbi:MAG: SDR family oxidoreductase [Planctomycetota bacterium]|nr:MAG: SDR family oxidoreductase [Planctomycetota bacterium]
MSVLSNKVAIVTGASSGIGRATALALAKRGARVALAARRVDRLDELAGEIHAGGGKAIAVQCDVTARDQVEALVAATRETFGPIDVLINNAGIMPLSFMDACKVEEWTRTVDVNVQGVLYGVGAVLKEMIERRSGHIVNVSSVAGRKVFPGGAVYCATKFAVHALSEGLRQELAGFDIRVTTIAPGLVTTELQDSITDERVKERFRNLPENFEALTSEDIAQSVLYALEAPAHVCVNEVLIRPTRQEM